MDRHFGEMRGDSLSHHNGGRAVLCISLKSDEDGAFYMHSPRCTKEPYGLRSRALRVSSRAGSGVLAGSCC